MRTERRAKQITLKSLEGRKVKLERRLDNLKREYVQVMQAIQQVSANLAESLKQPYGS